MCDDTVPYCQIYYITIIKYSANTVISLVNNSRYSAIVFNSAKMHNAHMAVAMAYCNFKSLLARQL